MNVRYRYGKEKYSFNFGCFNSHQTEGISRGSDEGGKTNLEKVLYARRLSFTLLSCNTYLSLRI